MNRSLAALIVTALVLSGCSTQTTETTAAPAPTTTLPTTTTEASVTTTGAQPTVDWTAIKAADWLMHDPEGIKTNQGSLVWDTDPVLGPDNLARDGRGGFVWLDVEGLWWLEADAARPRLVAPDVTNDLIEVIVTASGPVVRLGYFDPTYLSLQTGTLVDPVEGSIGFSEVGIPPWTAANGLAAAISRPVTELDGEGQPVAVLEHAVLTVRSSDGETILEMPAGGPYEEWARIHDFDGRRLVFSRGPFEPALPEETFVVIDLTCAECAASFTGGATNVAFVGDDSDWDGTGPAEQLRPLVATPLDTDAGLTQLDDGVYLGFLDPESVTTDRLRFDLAVWFSGLPANRAASDDGSSDVPVPNDYYIRNATTELLSITVASGIAATSVWYDYDTDPDLAPMPVAYSDLVAVMASDDEGVRANLRFSPWWLTIEDGELVRLDEQYVP